jgi:hypothetical protein
VEVCRLGRRTQIDFYCLGKNLEAYRDFVADYLDGLPPVERSAVEDQLWPGVDALVEKLNKLIDEAVKAQVIDEWWGSDFQMMGISLLFVASFTKMVEPTKRDFKPHGVKPRH